MDSKGNREQLQSMANSFSPVSLALLKDAPCTLLLNFPVEQRTRASRGARGFDMNNIKIKLGAFLEKCMHACRLMEFESETAECNRFFVDCSRNRAYLNLRSNPFIIRGCLIKYIYIMKIFLFSKRLKDILNYVSS